MKRFDAIIIGAGQAGPPLAGRLTAAGMTVAFIERKLYGGTCVNTGCMPTKTLVASAYAAHLAHRGDEYGVIDWSDSRGYAPREEPRQDRLDQRAQRRREVAARHEQAAPSSMVRHGSSRPTRFWLARSG